jgi:hypothetical protein
MSKGARIFYMFCVLFALMGVVDLMMYDSTGNYIMLDDKIFFTGLGVNLVLSVALINLWDYISNIMEGSSSTSWKIIRGFVIAISWLSAGLIAIFVVFGILLDMDSQGFFNIEFIKIVLVILGIASVVGAVRSIRKDS